MDEQPRPQHGEVTAPQVYGQSVPELMKPPGRTSYKIIRAMRVHPTIAMARALSVAPILAATWSVEPTDDAPEGAEELITDTFIPVRELLLESAMYGGIDFGWAPFEKVFGIDRDGREVIIKLKPLLHDMTDILVDVQTGSFAGFKQTTVRGPIVLPLENALLVSFRVEGTQWHGAALMENAKLAYDSWIEANTSAGVYDKKIAGSHFVVYYPLGVSTDKTGKQVPNHELAKLMIAGLEGSGSIAVPNVVSAQLDDLNEQSAGGWRIEILEDRGGRQPTFVNRLSYLDKMFVRGFLLPERAVLEGQFGTKAEAGKHADMALTNMDLQHKYVTRMANWHAVDQTLALNYGEETRGSVKLVAAPLADDKQAMLKDIYTEIIKNPAGFAEEYDWVDTAAVREQLGIPSLEKPEDKEKATPDAPEKIPDEGYPEGT